MTTNESDADSLLAPETLWPLLRHNAVYFVIGRNAGLLPYYFPGLLALILWVVRGPRRDVTTLAILLALGGSVLALLVFAPYSWAGGGGPAGNRYFLSLYPVLFFIIPAMKRWESGLAWVGGMTFVAPLLISPFISSRYIWQAVNTRALRMLPIELTMVDDLPVRLGPRSRIPFGTDPEVLLYFVDPKASGPEGQGVWVPGKRSEEILVRSEVPLARVGIRWRSPIATRVSAKITGREVSLDLQPGVEAVTSLQVGKGVPFRPGLQVYVLQLSSSSGFIPRMLDSGSTDGRFLGAFAELTFQR